jgi:glycine cleavage system aminomethyltransferase T/NADPH-dependent 2,4-dienoyl-CoA reductase/sulfur reductase-like enzyme
MTAHRIAGGLIDRSQPVRFSFDGKSYQGFAGDTLAAALLANGVKLVGRSFKYHRPRGILSAGSEEPNALVELRNGAYREPNTRATVAEIFEGLTAASQNRFPSLKHDFMGVLSYFAPLFAAGFYYKTFMWPASFWEKFYEPMIRRAAGLGRNAGMPDPDFYEKSTEFCDVLVIGGGEAGIEAAREAARTGGRVILCDESHRLGGQALSDGKAIDLTGLENVKILTRTTVFGVYDGGTYGAVERLGDHLAASHTPRQRYIRIIAASSVLASGAIERPLVFGNNDLPGVMLAGAVRAYIHRYAVALGRRAVLALNHDEAAQTIPALAKAGIAIAGIIDNRPQSSPQVRALAAEANAPLFAGAQLQRGIGKLEVSAAEILNADGSRVTLPCDLIAMSGGWNPALHLTSHLSGKPVWDAITASFIPDTLPPNMRVTGAAAGQGLNPGILPLWRSGTAREKAFVDYQNDVTATDVTLAKQEGFVAVEHLKRYTTLGMATDQGKTANVNGLALMAAATGNSIAGTGTTRFRPPYTPVALGALAGPHRGQNFKPVRLTPTDAWAKSQNATFIETGLWRRAQYFARAGEDWLAAVTREVNAVRNNVGICDVTTLGKIDIQGPDAAKFLDCVYTNHWANLPIGRARYGLMLREDGFVMDDGTCARLGERHYIMTTTTANAAKIMQHLEFCHQWLWPELDVAFISVTDQWAQLAIAGPQSRIVLEKIVDAPFDLSNAAFPYMAAGELTICGGTPARLFRLSFSGELAYELAVPARFGNALAQALMAAGAAQNITPYGTEALGVMRIEKGHPAGAELNGQTTAHDLGMGRLLSGKKDFIGRALSARSALTDPARPRLVGLKPLDGTTLLRAGSHLLPPGATAIASNDQGYITSAAFSPTLGHPIALAMLANGPARLGEIIRVYDPVRNGDTLAEITAPVFYDAARSRLHV